MMDNPAVDAATRQSMLQRMLEIRISEEQIQSLFLQNLVRGSTHLCIGQEACSVGIARALKKGDTVTCTYRGHGHALALGMSIKKMMGEMMGKASGACKGKGGSMHLTDASIGLLGENAVVGAGLPIAVGAGLSAQVMGEDRVSVAIFGEGATNIGAFHEALNMAAVWKLPVLFICENNLYGEYSPMANTTPVADIAVRATSYNIPGVIVDGQDVETVYHEVKAARERAQRGEGPTLIELKTYRYKGHSRTDPATYRAEGELDQWMKRDPLTLLFEKMKTDGQIDDVEYDEMKQATERVVFEAIEWAKAEPFPPLEALFEDIYA
ncbi:MAG: thiamine pyrophosphate-dependent dehydrogenase E1 component subunit alpha [Chloroflexota bacterium]